MSPVCSIIIVITCFIAIIILPRYFIKSAGDRGESIVAKCLDFLSDEYHVINNVVIDKDGYTNQIDHVVVSPYGIFCIETKNMKGYIYGTEYVQYWTQNVWGRKYKFFNPILQNGKHVKALRHELAKYGDLEIYPITVFTRRAKLYVKKSKDISLVYDNELLDEIKSFSEEVIPKDKVENIVDFISISEGFQYTKKREHVQRAKQAKLMTTLKENEMICPRCGGRLVERKGRYGRFIGCSNYPNCKYTDRVE